MVLRSGLAASVVRLRREDTEGTAISPKRRRRAAHSPEMAFHESLYEAHLVLDARIVQLDGRVGAEIGHIPETRDIVLGVTEEVGYDLVAFVQLHER